MDIALNVLFNLPYLTIRKFMVYLLDERMKEKELELEVELIRDKAA